MTPEETRLLLKNLLSVHGSSNDVSYQVLSEEDKGSYLQKLISYTGYESDLIRAYLLLPKGKGPLPSVFIHHQHNSEWHLGKSEAIGIAGDPLNGFGPVLAARGFIVLAPDVVGFEDRRRHRSGIEPDAAEDRLQYFNGMCYRLAEGRLLMTTILSDAMIGVSLLEKLPGADPGRIGVVGHSMGGNLGIFHAAIDDRISFLCASGAACSYKKKLENGTGLELSLVIPGILKWLDLPEILRCINPRNVLLVSGKEDVYSKDAVEIVDEIRQKLVQDAEPDRLEHKQYEGGHALTKARFDFISDWITRAANLLP